MSDQENLTGSSSVLKQKLLAALQSSITGSGGEVSSRSDEPERGPEVLSTDLQRLNSDRQTANLPDGKSVYSLLTEEEGETDEDTLPQELMESRARLTLELEQVQRQEEATQAEKRQKTEFDDTLSKRGVVPDAQTETYHPAGAPSSSIQDTQVKTKSVNSGGSMADLSGYKDLSKAPISFGDEDLPMSSLSSAADTGYERSHSVHSQFSSASHFVQEVAPQEVDTEFSGNVKTLIRLVSELPEGVTKQTGAQIIRLTMEAMGISMEDVLSEAQSAQSEMLDAVRANIKKIEEYKTVIRKLETDIKYYQGKANELSEIIDLFILSNTTGNKMPIPDDLNH